MLLPAPPLTNAERQRQFQEAHPGYDRRRKARQRAGSKRKQAQMLAEIRASAAVEQQSRRLTFAKPLLMLPAPVVDPLTEEINALADKLAQARAKQAA